MYFFMIDEWLKDTSGHTGDWSFSMGSNKSVGRAASDRSLSLEFDTISVAMKQNLIDHQIIAFDAFSGKVILCFGDILI